MRKDQRSPALLATPHRSFNALMDDDFGAQGFNDILMEDLEPLNPYEDRLTGAIRNIQLRYIGEKET